MSTELIKRFRIQLGNKSYQELEDTWLEMLDDELPLTELLNLIELTVRWAPKELAVTLLWVLSTSLAERKLYAQELTVLHRLSELTPQDDKLTQAITTCLHNLYPNQPLLGKLLQKSGLGFGEPLSEALRRFDRYFNLIPGRLVYDPERGTGRIKNLDLLFDRVEVVFDSGARTTIDVQSAANRFRFLAQDGFFYLQAEQPEKLSQLALFDPAQVVVLFLRDIGRPATVTEIQQALEPIVGKKEYQGFWERAKKGLSLNPHIAIQTRPARSYRWLEQLEGRGRILKAKTMTRGQIMERTKDSNPIYDVTRLSDQEPTEIIKTFELLRTATERRQFLFDLARVRTEDWDGLYLKLFAIAPDNRTRTVIASQLQKEKPERWQELIQSVLTGYRTNPDAFLFLAEKIPTITARQVLSRLLDIIEIDTERSRRNQAKKIIIADNYSLVVRALEEMDEDEASRLLQRIKANRTLEPFQQDEISTLIVTRFTRLVQEPPATVIWSSAAGIEKAKQELNTLVQKELPKSAEEIARARAFGDLRENYEYKAAKERQARLMTKINQLQRELKSARPLQPDQINTTQVNIGCRVQLCDQNGGILEFAILGPWDADPDQGVISFQSPLAQGLLGKKPGDTIQMGEKRLTVVQISRAL
ncbi:MAG: GreA/GreB family elongation factor [bacterium]